MNMNEASEIFLGAICSVRADGDYAVAEDVERLRNHYRKLAEREKALTEALEAVLDTCRPDDYEGIDALSSARDALALHKEDA